MYVVAEYSICVAFVFVLAGFLFAVSVAVLMAVEEFKVARHMAPSQHLRPQLDPWLLSQGLNGGSR